MRRLTLPFLAALLAGIPVLSDGQTDLTGYWVFRVPRDNNDGTFQESFFELKREGEAVTGRALKGTGGESHLEWNVSRWQPALYGELAWTGRWQPNPDSL